MGVPEHFSSLITNLYDYSTVKALDLVSVNSKNFSSEQGPRLVGTQSYKFRTVPTEVELWPIAIENDTL